jgi:hypothetical protein
MWHKIMCDGNVKCFGGMAGTPPPAAQRMDRQGKKDLKSKNGGKFLVNPSLPRSTNESTAFSHPA